MAGGRAGAAVLSCSVALCAWHGLPGLFVPAAQGGQRLVRRARHAVVAVEQKAYPNDKSLACLRGMLELMDLAWAMPDGDLRQMARRLMAQDAEPGEVIVRKGDEGTSYYIVEDGAFDVYEEESGVRRKVSEVSPGGGFGELSLLYNAPRSATVVARGEGKLWRMEGTDFLKIMSKATELPETILKGFRENPQLGGLFWLLPDVDFLQLCKSMSPLDLEAGAAVLTEGESGSTFYVVDYGTFQVSVKGQQTRQLGPGESFGELALLYDKPRSASVVAMSTSRLWVMESERFSQAVAKIHGRPIHRVQQTVDFLRGVNLFKSLGTEELKMLAEILRPRVFKRGEVLARAGDKVNQICILKLGKVSAWKESDVGEELEAVYSKPATVIDRAVVEGTVCPCTLRSESDVVLVFWISKLSFENMFEGSKEKMLRDLDEWNAPDWWPFR